MKRFVSEYANYKKQDILKNPLMPEQIKAEQIQRITQTIRLTDRGMITIDEAMRALVEVK